MTGQSFLWGVGRSGRSAPRRVDDGSWSGDGGAMAIRRLAPVASSSASRSVGDGLADTGQLRSVEVARGPSAAARRSGRRSRRASARRPSVTRTSTTRRSSGTRVRSTKPALLDPVDEPGRVRERHVEHLGQPAHRHLAVALERVQDVELGHADAEPDAGARSTAHFIVVIAARKSAMMGAYGSSARSDPRVARVAAAR